MFNINNYYTTTDMFCQTTKTIDELADDGEIKIVYYIIIILLLFVTADGSG